MTPSADPDHDRANQLYWESDRSVNDIAEEMELSKGMLYQLIEPLDAAADCPECGGALEFANRTALDRGLMQCPDCGTDEITEDDLGAPRTDEAPSRPRTRSDSDGSTSHAHDPVADRQALIGVGLLASAALLWLAGFGRD